MYWKVSNTDVAANRLLTLSSLMPLVEGGTVFLPVTRGSSDETDADAACAGIRSARSGDEVATGMPVKSAAAEDTAEDDAGTSTADEAETSTADESATDDGEADASAAKTAGSKCSSCAAPPARSG